jgi:hypothetical protein
VFGFRPILDFDTDFIPKLPQKGDIENLFKLKYRYGPGA